MDLENQFPDNVSSVHKRQGHEDDFMPVMLQLYIAQRLSWVHYHELPMMGCLFAFDDGMFYTTVKEMSH